MPPDSRSRAFGHREPPFGVEAILSHKNAGQWDELATTPLPTTWKPLPSRKKAGQWDWRTHVSLEWNAASADRGYPSSVQLDDGTIVTLYYGVGALGKLAESGQGLVPYAKCIRYREADLTDRAVDVEVKINR